MMEFTLYLQIIIFHNESSLLHRQLQFKLQFRTSTSSTKHVSHKPAEPPLSKYFNFNVLVLSEMIRVFPLLYPVVGWLHKPYAITASIPRPAKVAWPNTSQPMQGSD
ncbi:hypothetical protein ILYODFUR_006589 [Ilyodon furcidens]|uniref:Uncharacterized protein n=1 Tax=Ilyodon furcidens TaxID=33524 RepID=A0ABV0TWP1_9TELE